MKVRFNCDSGANIHSNRKSNWLDTVADLGFDEGEWENMTNDQKFEEAEIWANERLEIWWEEE